MKMTNRIGRRAMAISLPLLLAVLLALASSASAQEGRFFLRAGAGYSVPFLTNLNEELEHQGNAKVDPGYSLGISLGRTFSEMPWSVEAHFSTVFYPDFNYKNANNSFVGKLRHYNYMAIIRWSVRPEGKLFKPTIGAGLGYGLTNLITGGGKLGAPEGVFTGRIDSEVGGNVDLSFECIYYAGMQSKRFEKPFLKNVDTDFIVDSADNPLEDKFYSLDFRVGITVWLKPRMGQ